MRPLAIALPRGGDAIRGTGEKLAAKPVTGTDSRTVPSATRAGQSAFGPVEFEYSRTVRWRKFGRHPTNRRRTPSLTALSASRQQLLHLEGMDNGRISLTWGECPPRRAHESGAGAVRQGGIVCRARFVLITIL